MATNGMTDEKVRCLLEATVRQMKQTMPTLPDEEIERLAQQEVQCRYTNVNAQQAKAKQVQEAA